MFDLGRIKNRVAEHYFKLFRIHGRPEETDRFVRRWLELLSAYSSLAGFVSFDSEVPLLDRLSPRARSVLVVSFRDVTFYVPSHVSVFPLYPFRVNLSHRSVCCREGRQLLVDYLRITGVSTVCFYRVDSHRAVAEELKATLPGLRCYYPSQLKFFFRVSKRDGGASSRSTGPMQESRAAPARGGRRCAPGADAPEIPGPRSLPAQSLLHLPD